jgi:cell division protein FtsB
MRFLSIVLIGLLMAVQHPLWIGKGGWLRVWELDRQNTRQKSINDALAQRNNALGGEVADLKRGMQAVEERARYELGMIRRDEIFVQFTKPGADQSAQR